MTEHLEKKVEPKMGMWLFIGTELLLFGGLFLLYAIYRLSHPDDFASASLGHSRIIGTLNTVILITSSYTVALSIHFQKEKKSGHARLALIGTILLGVVFLSIKAFEWAEKIGEGIYPGNQALQSLPAGVILYHSLYFLMTGLHALHMMIGIGVLIVIYFAFLRGSGSVKSALFLETSGLYWHMVDIVWIFLFPLFYLIT
jgi:cytochrome c oxidase subunit 3